MVLRLLAILVTIWCTRVRYLHGINSGQDLSGDGLRLAEPEEKLDFAGGSVCIWRRDVGVFSDVRVDVSEITFKEDGLMVPQYADSYGISYVLEGTGKVGVVLPFGSSRRLHIRRVQQGDIVAVPKGIVFWWYNDGYGMHKIFCASDTSNGVQPGRYHQYAFAGPKIEEFGGLLHGFSRESLAAAWGVDEEVVAAVLDNQNTTSIVKARRRITLPDPRGHWSLTNCQWDHEHLESEEFRYSLDREYPDLFVGKGGWMKVVDHRHLPILDRVGMSAVRVGLEKDALEAPLFFARANQIVYIVKGSGRIEVSGGNGESILSSEVQQGSVLVIPSMIPSVKVAGADGMSCLTFLTATRAAANYLAGANSVYRRIPTQVLAASMNVDEEVIRRVVAYGEGEESILPPPAARGGAGPARPQCH